MHLMFKGKLFSSEPALEEQRSGEQAWQREEEQTPRKLQQCYHSSFLPSAGHTLIFTPGLSHKPGASPSLQVSLHFLFFF